jgi:hypothetical protein
LSTTISVPGRVDEPADDPPASVTAIVPTLADERRRESLLRAIDSLRAAARHARLTITAVVNGDRFDSGVLDSVLQRDVTILQVPEPSLPGALLAGRRSVTSDYFCFLDDDDEYLPSAIDRRIAALDRRPDCAMVTTNGYRRLAGADSMALSQMDSIPSDPLSALFRENWLPSCAGLFRSAAIGVELFGEPHAYLEWTWLAYRIASRGLAIAVLDEPTFRIHDSASSLSKSGAYRSSHIALYRRMLDTATRGDIRGSIRRRLASALSSESAARLEENRLAEAWKLHCKALACPGGWRRGSQTLRLVAASIARLAVQSSTRRR